MIIIGASVVYICTYETAQTGSLGQVRSAPRSAWLWPWYLNLALNPYLCLLYGKDCRGGVTRVQNRFLFRISNQFIIFKVKIKNLFCHVPWIWTRDPPPRQPFRNNKDTPVGTDRGQKSKTCWDRKIVNKWSKIMNIFLHDIAFIDGTDIDGWIFDLGWPQIF